jgi:uncharacterized caspase-like protein
MRRTQRTFLWLLLPVLLLAAGGIVNPALAQQQEKRIALVVGNGAYAKSALATAANDAGLIAQTLQAAGFDVVGARDLDGDTLRKSFRDFIQKAQSSGRGTVAMIYLAGYGVQLAGENYFIPVDSSIARDTDIPTEALRVGDYVRQLAALPLKASVVVLDAARQQPFIEGGQPIASGLALVEPEANMLIAFNAAPGTVAPEEPGPYGSYAQSLAEMIRTGGLSLPEVFDRLRLRVNEASKGAQVPWNAQKLDAQFTFFERGPDAPPLQPAPAQDAAIRSKPIRDLGVQDAYVAALERDTLPAYEEFLAAYPDDPLAKRVRAIVAARREAITWRRTYRADTPEAYWSYLRRYPRGPHAADAQRRLAILTAPLEPPPAFAMIDYDVPPPPPEEVIYVDRPVLMFSDPEFGFVPPPPPPVFFLPPPPPDFVVLPPPIAPVGLFVLPQPVFVPIPVFVRAPVYVAPPPNNIVFTNIHNTTVINTVINRPPVAGLSPGSLAPAVSGRATPAGPAVPPAVAMRASLIQQGRVPVPPSASINPTARQGASRGAPVGTPAPTPANVAPGAAPQAQPRLPEANTLPVPGARGMPPAPAGAASTPPAAAGTPGARTAPAAAAPAGSAPPARADAPATTTAPSHAPPSGAAGAPPAPAPRPPVAERSPATVPDRGARSTGHQPAALPPPTAGAGRPAPPSARPVAPPPAVAAPQVRPEPRRVAPPPPQVARPAAPAAPPPRPQAVARPAPPPPPVRAVPPPPVRVAPPPAAAARPTSPPAAVARPAPPPPPPRVAVAPPRPAPAQAAKKCPPNQPRC